MEYNTAGNPIPVTAMPSCSGDSDSSLTSSTTFDIGPASTFTDYAVPAGSLGSFIRGALYISHGSYRCLHFSALNGQTASPFNSNNEKILNGGSAGPAAASKVGVPWS